MFHFHHLTDDAIHSIIKIHAPSPYLHLSQSCTAHLARPHHKMDPTIHVSSQIWHPLLGHCNRESLSHHSSKWPGAIPDGWMKSLV